MKISDFIEKLKINQSRTNKVFDDCYFSILERRRLLMDRWSSLSSGSLEMILKKEQTRYERMSIQEILSHHISKHCSFHFFFLTADVQEFGMNVLIFGLTIPLNSDRPGVEAPPSERRSQVGTISVCSSVMSDRMMKSRPQRLNGHWPDSSSSWLQPTQRETTWEWIYWKRFKMCIIRSNPFGFVMNAKHLKYLLTSA